MWRGKEKWGRHCCRPHSHRRVDPRGNASRLACHHRHCPFRLCAVAMSPGARADAGSQLGRACPEGLSAWPFPGPKPSAFVLAASSGEASARGRSFTIGNRTSVVGLSGDACLGRYRRIGCSTFPRGFAQRAFLLLRRRCIVASITSLVFPPERQAILRENPFRVRWVEGAPHERVGQVGTRRLIHSARFSRWTRVDKSTARRSGDQ